MKRILLIFALLMHCSIGAAAEPIAKEVVSEVYSKLESLNPYKVEIEVLYNNESISGLYEVDNDKYYISIEGSKLFGDSHEKYEVFENRNEVVIDVVAEDYNGNILNNPATAFKAIKDHYNATLLQENEKFITIQLNQNIDTDSVMESIELAVSKDTKLPTEIIYNYDGDVVKIKVLNILPLTSSITSYNHVNYADYEVIDFR